MVAVAVVVAGAGAGAVAVVVAVVVACALSTLRSAAGRLAPSRQGRCENRREQRGLALACMRRSAHVGALR